MKIVIFVSHKRSRVWTRYFTRLCIITSSTCMIFLDEFSRLFCRGLHEFSRMLWFPPNTLPYTKYILWKILGVWMKRKTHPLNSNLGVEGVRGVLIKTRWFTNCPKDAKTSPFPNFYKEEGSIEREIGRTRSPKRTHIEEIFRIPNRI